MDHPAFEMISSLKKPTQESESDCLVNEADIHDQQDLLSKCYTYMSSPGLRSIRRPSPERCQVSLFFQPIQHPVLYLFSLLTQKEGKGLTVSSVQTKPTNVSHTTAKYKVSSRPIKSPSPNQSAITRFLVWRKCDLAEKHTEEFVL